MILIFIALTHHQTTSAVVYDNDDREFVYDSESSFVREVSQSIAAKIKIPSSSNLQDSFNVSTVPLKKRIKNLCHEEKFSHGPTLSNCTGFLVGTDLMVTAGHCINDKNECLKSHWLFSASLNPESRDPLIYKKDIYQCTQILSRVKNSISKNDYTLFRVDRIVKNRTPLKFRKEGKIKNDDQFLVIGHPNGLPLISTYSTNVFENDSEFLFKINSDTFGGNSGSPVFNIRTGLVEGILTDGEIDYRLNKQRQCREINQCLDKECKGENVVRITNIPELVPGMTPIGPIIDFNNLRL